MELIINNTGRQDTFSLMRKSVTYVLWDVSYLNLIKISMIFLHHKVKKGYLRAIVHYLPAIVLTSAMGSRSRSFLCLQFIKYQRQGSEWNNRSIFEGQRYILS